MISPTEFRAATLHPATLHDIETTIDHAIGKASATGKSPITVAVCEGWSPRALDHVLGLYRAAGWRVERIADRRDGDFLTLIPTYP